MLAINPYPRDWQIFFLNNKSVVSEEKVSYSHFMLLKHTGDRYIDYFFLYVMHHREYLHKITLYMSVMGCVKEERKFLIMNTLSQQPLIDD